MIASIREASKKILAVGVSAAFSVACFAPSAFADESRPWKLDSDYMQKVTIASGDSGEFVAYNDYVPVSSEVIELNSSIYNSAPLYIQLSDEAATKYYPKGIRLASVNNGSPMDFARSQGGGYATFEVVDPENNIYVVNFDYEPGSDQQYVVAYDSLGSRVTYRVAHKDQATGEVLGYTDYYGNVGDQVSAISLDTFDRYRPVKTEKGTLKGENQEFVCWYQKLPDNIQEIINNGDGTYTVVYIDGTREILYPRIIDEYGPAAVLTTANGEVVVDDNGTPLAAGVEEVNITDEENPLASIDMEDESALLSNSPMTWILPLLSAIVVAGLIVAFAAMVRNRRKESAATASEASLSVSSEETSEK